MNWNVRALIHVNLMMTLHSKMQTSAKKRLNRPSNKGLVSRRKEWMQRSVSITTASVCQGTCIRVSQNKERLEQVARSKSEVGAGLVSCDVAMLQAFAEPSSSPKLQRDIWNQLATLTPPGKYELDGEKFQVNPDNFSICKDKYASIRYFEQGAEYSVGNNGELIDRISIVGDTDVNEHPTMSPMGACCGWLQKLEHLHSELKGSSLEQFLQLEMGFVNLCVADICIISLHPSYSAILIRAL